MISTTSVSDRHYHRDDQRDRKYYPNRPTAIRPDNPFEIIRDQIARNPAGKKNRGYESRDQPCRSFQTVGTSKDELLGVMRSQQLLREKATVTNL